MTLSESRQHSDAVGRIEVQESQFAARPYDLRQRRPGTVHKYALLTRPVNVLICRVQPGLIF